MRKGAVITVVFLSLSLFFSPPARGALSDEEFLDKLQRDCFLYFLNEVNPENGLIKDSSRPGAPCSVAAVGFGLTALCIGEARGWITRKDAYNRILTTLSTFRDNVPHEHGFFYHFLDIRNGERAWSSEVSSIDTALFLAGALYAGEYFKGTGIEKIAGEIYGRVDWPWMMNGRDILCMGWKPETGFLRYYWDSYSESMILYALAIGSPTHPIEKEAWFAWQRPVGSYKDFELVYCYTGSIFTYQYSHAWIDFRKIREYDVDWHANSAKAVQSNKAFCIDNSETYAAYNENCWGLTACIGPEGYKGYGAKPGKAVNDGTIAPYGMAASIVFAEEESVNGLRYLYDNYKDFLYGKYGFKDAFNIDRDWWSEEYLGIDVGITILMIENARTGMVWNDFMETAPIKRWVKKVFQKK